MSLSQYLSPVPPGVAGLLLSGQTALNSPCPDRQVPEPCCQAQQSPDLDLSHFLYVIFKPADSPVAPPWAEALAVGSGHSRWMGDTGPQELARLVP